MAIPNVDKITSTLARLPDQALQQYAAMHKNDPYIMSLAMSESNRRKEIRAAAQGMQGMQPQPKVVDAALAQMAPQESGIATLPAPNMQMMADGGIAGYEGYDEGESTYGQEPVTMMAGGGAVERYNGQAGSLTGDIPGFVAGTGNFIPQQGAPEEVPLFRRMFRDARATGASYQIEQAKARIAAGVGTSADEAILAAAQSEQNKGPSAQDMAMFDAASDLYMTERANKQAANKPAAGPTPPAADKKRGAAPRPGTGAGPAATQRTPAVDPFSMEALKAAQREAGGDYSGGELRNRAAEMRSALEQQGEERLASRKKEIESEGDIYKGREERLAKREADIGKQRDENQGMALLNAGLAIMSTPGKLAEAIGKGAQVGTAQYAAGLKDLRAAQQKLEDARDNIEDLRLNRSDMNKREIRALEKERDANINKGNELMFGVTKDLYGMDREDTRSLVKSYTEGQQKKAQIQSAERIALLGENRADARANAPTADMREAMLLGTGNTPEEKYLSGLKVKQALLGDKQGTQLFKMFLEENGRREKNAEKPLTLDQFRRQSAAFFAPPAAVDISKPTRP